MTSTRDATEAPARPHEETDSIAAEMAVWRRRYEKADVRETAFSNSTREVQPLYTSDRKSVV
jgi:hypothetical protein